MKKICVILLILMVFSFCQFTLNAWAENIGNVAAPGSSLSVIPDCYGFCDDDDDDFLEPEVRQDEYGLWVKSPAKGVADLENAPCVLSGPATVLDENS